MSERKKVLTIIGEKARYHAKKIARDVGLHSPEVIANLENGLRLAFGRSMALEARKNNRHKGQKSLFAPQPSTPDDAAKEKR